MMVSDPQSDLICSCYGLLTAIFRIFPSAHSAGFVKRPRFGSCGVPIASSWRDESDGGLRSDIRPHLHTYQLFLAIFRCRLLAWTILSNPPYFRAIGALIASSCRDECNDGLGSAIRPRPHKLRPIHAKEKPDGAPISTIRPIWASYGPFMPDQASFESNSNVPIMPYSRLFCMRKALEYKKVHSCRQKWPNHGQRMPTNRPLKVSCSNQQSLVVEHYKKPL